jgi:hypothetical protein
MIAAILDRYIGLDSFSNDSDYEYSLLLEYDAIDFIIIKRSSEIYSSESQRRH